MLYISEVYNLLLDELRTDQRGLTCDVDSFNRLIRLVNQEIYEDYVKEFESGQESSDSLGFLKIHNREIALTANTGVGSLPSNYERLIGKPRILDGTTYRKVDLVSTYEQACRDDDYLTQPTVTHPTATIGGTDLTINDYLQIRVKPVTITTVWIDYFKMLTTPFLDYYTNDTSYVNTFLSETSTAQSVPAGSTYRDGTVGGAAVTVSSLTVDLRWGESDLSLIVQKLINRIAKQLPDELLLQQTNMEQAKSDA